jgi:hypothetical protein
VSGPRIELHPVTPWVLRAFDRVPLPAFWVGIGLGLALFALFLLYTTVFGEGLGRLGGLGFASWAAELHQDLFFGLTLALVAASVRGALRDFDALAPVLRPARDDLGLLRREMLRYWPRPLHALALGFGLFSGIGTPLDLTLWEGRVFPGWDHPAPLWLALRNFANWWAVGLAMGLELMLGLRFSRLADHLGDLDLLDRGALAPFGRRAVRNVSLWMLLAAFLSVTYAGRGWAGAMLPLALVNLAGFAAVAFALPLLGVRRRLRAAKAEELARVRRALRVEREKALDPAGSPPGRLGDLLALEARVESVREWPIEAPALARLAVFVTIGLGSWVGAALVEKLLGRVLG